MLRQALLLVFFGFQLAGAADVKQVPLWDGETNRTYGDLLLNRFGGPVVHMGATKITVTHVTNVVHSGGGAYRAAIAGPVADYAFFQLSLSGFGPSSSYVMSRDVRRFDSLCFWVKNETAAPFTLKLEIKDYRDNSAHLQYRRFPVPASNAWVRFCAPLGDATGWTVVGNPDLQQARLVGFVLETTPAFPMNGAVYFDDVVLVEPGGPMDTESASLPELVQQVARRQFDGLWGSRSRTHGMIPLNSVFADVGALNSTSAVVKLLPAALRQGWLTQAEADAYITTLVGTLNTLMSNSTYLPPRYVNWLTLAPNYVLEESPVDAAFMALALYQYKWLPNTPSGLRTQIDALLARFNFAAFGSPQGWKLAYRSSAPQGFTDGSYDGYSGETWIISLAAHLMPQNRVGIAQYYHTGTHREKTSLVDPRLAYVVHSDSRFRAPFLQWLFPLFVNVSDLSTDNYPDPALATNPLQNAIRYQSDCHQRLAQQARALFPQADAGDDGSGLHYEQYSCANSFGKPELFMPWSVAFSLLAEPGFAEPALRSHLARGLYGPLGLSDSVHWTTGAAAASQVTALHDFWNVSLSTMAMTQFLYRDNESLTNLPEVRAALREVFPQPCAYAIDTSGLSVPASGGNIALTIATDAGCPWSIADLPEWLSVPGGIQGTGSSIVTVAVGAGGSRSASLSVGGVSVPVRQLDGAACGGSSSCIMRALPHLAFGGQWTTGLSAISSGTAAGSYSVSFYGDAGADLALPFTGGLGNLSTLSNSVPAGGMMYYEAENPNVGDLSGWGLVTADESVATQATFRRRTPSGQFYEAAVPSGGGYSRFVMPFDVTTFAPNGAQLFTAFAVVNLNPSADAHFVCTARNQSGGLIPNAVSIPALGPLGHYTAFNFPLLTGRGTLDCSADTLVSAIGLRAIGGDAISTLPVIPK